MRILACGAAAAALATVGCLPLPSPSPRADGDSSDAGPLDAAVQDAAVQDAAAQDAAFDLDAGPPGDATTPVEDDAGVVPDAGATDGGAPAVGAADAGSPDGPPDALACVCPDPLAGESQYCVEARLRGEGGTWFLRDGCLTMTLAAFEPWGDGQAARHDLRSLTGRLIHPDGVEEEVRADPGGVCEGWGAPWGAVSAPGFLRVFSNGFVELILCHIERVGVDAGPGEIAGPSFSSSWTLPFPHPSWFVLGTTARFDGLGIHEAEWVVGGIIHVETAVDGGPIDGGPIDGGPIDGG